MTTLKSMLVGSMLFATTGIAHAEQKIFTVQATNFCDVFQYHVETITGRTVGADIGCGYTNAFGAGSALYVPAIVAPGGKVHVLAGMFNTAGYTNQVYINTKTMTIDFYNTKDGVNYGVNQSPITFMHTTIPSPEHALLPAMGAPGL